MKKPTLILSILLILGVAAATGSSATPQQDEPSAPITETNELVMICLPDTNGIMQIVKPWPLLTNSFFINFDPFWSSQVPAGIYVKPARIQEAREAPECQPAEKDPAGNWGTPVQGYQLSLRLPKQAFTNGEVIDATVIFRNDGVQELRAPTEFPRHDTQLILTNEKGEVVRSLAEEALDGLSPFQRGLRTLVKSPHSIPMMPKTQVKEHARIDQLFRLAAPQIYHLQVKYRTVVGTEVIVVYSGTATFEIVDQ